MKFILNDAAGIRQEIIELTTLEELMNLVKKEDHPIICYPQDNIHNYDDVYNYPVLTIYNDYLE